MKVNKYLNNFSELINGQINENGIKAIKLISVLKLGGDVNYIPSKLYIYLEHTVVIAIVIFRKNVISNEIVHVKSCEISVKKYIWLMLEALTHTDSKIFHILIQKECVMGWVKPFLWQVSPVKKGIYILIRILTISGKEVKEIAS